MKEESDKKNKIEEALSEVLSFLRQLYDTYLGLLLRPVRFFRSPDETRLKQSVFVFISCFLFSIFLTGFSTDQGILYFLQNPRDYILTIWINIQDFSFIKSFIKCVLYICIIYLFGTIVTKLFKSPEEKKFSYSFYVYYSGWQLMTVFIIMALVSLYHIIFPFENIDAGPTILGLFNGLFEALFKLMLMAVFALPIICFPIIAMIRIRRKTTTKKYYFRMIIVALLVFVSFAFNVIVGERLTNFQNEEPEAKFAYYYYKDYNRPIYVCNYKKDSVLMKIKLVIVNPTNNKLLIDPENAGRIYIERKNDDDSINKTLGSATPSLEFNNLSDYRFSIDYVNGADNFITIDSSNKKIVNLRIKMQKQDFIFWQKLINDTSNITTSLEVYADDVDFEMARLNHSRSSVIEEAGNNAVLTSQFKNINQLKQKKN
jgi:hypothetical protein